MQREVYRIENMNSSEMGFSGVRSSFSKTCSALSQFLKENGRFDDLSLSLSKKSETKESETPTTTMNLFPGSGDTDLFNINRQQTDCSDETHKKSNPSECKPDPLTIFYAGQVVVFKDFPADKLLEIMNMASKSSCRNNLQHVTFRQPHAAELATSTQNIVPIANLPIARKHSLARFLEKRKDRITASAPYQANKVKEMSFKPVKVESWLGLAPESDHISFQMQRH